MLHIYHSHRQLPDDDDVSGYDYDKQISHHLLKSGIRKSGACFKYPARHERSMTFTRYNNYPIVFLFKSQETFILHHKTQNIKYGVHRA